MRSALSGLFFLSVFALLQAVRDLPKCSTYLHVPAQSGSETVLKRMKRGYTTDLYRERIAILRSVVPDLELGSDWIVGFPGETEEDFQATLDVVAASRFASAFTFQYSKRPGTPAAELPGQVPKAVVSERYQRLIDLQERISLEENTAVIGRSVELLVATGEGRKDAATARMSGRARDGRLVHFHPGEHGEQIRPGDIVTTTVTGAAPHHLIADAPLLDHRRTRAGDAHVAGRKPRTGVSLGMPGVGVAATAPAASVGCTR